MPSIVFDPPRERACAPATVVVNTGAPIRKGITDLARRNAKQQQVQQYVWCLGSVVLFHMRIAMAP